MTPPETVGLADTLGRLVGAVDQQGRDLGEIKTSCAVLVERSARHEQDVRDLEARHEQDVAELRAQLVAAEGRVTLLERARWRATGALVGAAGAAGSGAGWAAQALGG